MTKKTADERTDRQLRSASAKAERTPEQRRLALKRQTRMFYDMQRLRMQMAGRTHHPTEDKEDEDKTPHIDLHEVDVETMGRISGTMSSAEHECLGYIKALLKQWPIYENYMKSIRGLGPTMSAVILSEFDIHVADTPSHLWSFAGLAPTPCKRCKTCFAVVTENKDGTWKHQQRRKVKCIRGDSMGDGDVKDGGRAMRPTKGEKLPYNAFLKTKVVGVLGGCLIKCGSEYRKFYDDYKHRQVSAGWGESDLHRHRAAIRYMVKMLLTDIWREWRTLEGLEVRPSYAEEYLGRVHHG